MSGPSKDPNEMLILSRRGLLLSGAALFAGGMVASLCPGMSLAAVDTGLQTRFMQLSNLLVNHKLNPEVGARIVDTAASQYKQLPAMLDAIIKIAETKNAAIVEDFFADIPDGDLKTFAHWVISAWYSGCSSDKRDAKLFTYEEALAFQTTRDVITIPSYGLSGPNLWTRPNLPLSAAMPTF